MTKSSLLAAVALIAVAVGSSQSASAQERRASINARDAADALVDRNIGRKGIVADPVGTESSATSTRQIVVEPVGTSNDKGTGTKVLPIVIGPEGTGSGGGREDVASTDFKDRPAGGNNTIRIVVDPEGSDSDDGERPAAGNGGGRPGTGTSNIVVAPEGSDSSDVDTAAAIEADQPDDDLDVIEADEPAEKVEKKEEKTEAKKDFASADELIDLLKSKGYTVEIIKRDHKGDYLLLVAGDHDTGYLLAVEDETGKVLAKRVVDPADYGYGGDDSYAYDHDDYGHGGYSSSYGNGGYGYSRQSYSFEDCEDGFGSSARYGYGHRSARYGY